QHLQDADDRIIQMDSENSYYRHGYKDAYKAYYTEYQKAMRLKNRISIMLTHLAEIKKREKEKNLKMQYIAHQLDKLAHEDVMRKSHY
ncbi:hypothetical protein, partial [Salmonella sp. s51228]|uniref:hypothetical protein n=1 Tax=Salmonella sp. s51228 TaxID=3159652 RepID=UPI0039816D71